MDDKTQDIIVETTKEIAKEVYTDGMKPAVKQVGGVFSTMAGFFNNVVLYPLKKLNIRFEQKAKAFEKEMQEKYNTIPEENRIEPPINVIGPALEVLKYSIDEEHIRNMFSNLLVNSMDNRLTEIVHPKYVKIIEQMNNKDAILLKILWTNTDREYLICQPQIVFKNKTMKISNCLIPNYITNINTPDLTDNEISFALENLQNLGLIELSFIEFFKEEEYIELIKTNSVCQEELQKIKKARPDLTDLTCYHSLYGVIKLTEISKNFCDICL